MNTFPRTILIHPGIHYTEVLLRVNSKQGHLMIIMLSVRTRDTSGIPSQPHLKGEPYMYFVYVQKAFFCTFLRSSPSVAGLFSRSRPQGTQGGCGIQRTKLGHRPSSVAHALGVQSRASCSLSRDCVPPRRAKQSHGNPKLALVSVFALSPYNL